MTTTAPTPLGILGIGTHLPSGQITNARVAQTAGVTEEWIIRATGIRTRYSAGPDEAASDLGAQALRSALAAAGIDPNQLDLIVTATSTPDELGPATACRIQHQVKAQNAVALDVNAACSGWLYGSHIARDWLTTNRQARYAAVVTVDTYTKYLDMSDRATAVLFSDGAAATIIGPTPEGGFHDIHLGSDGSQADHILIPAGGSRIPITDEVINRGDHLIHMNGRAIRDFAYDVFPRIITGILTRNRLDLDDIDTFIVHQPNPVLLRRLAEKTGIPPERLVVTGDEVGNIGCACAPYALATAAARGLIKPRGKVLAATFGAGMTWGGALLTWTGAPSIQTHPAGPAA